MKRFRVFPVDFDTRVHSLTRDIREEWEESVKQTHRVSKENVERGLVYDFGKGNSDKKRQNFVELGPKPMSILAFHNLFLEQIRQAFVIGAYYPALTAACTLGERILNHLILELRDDFKGSAEYKRVYNKSSFDHWDLPINTLESWDVLLPEAAQAFRVLRDLRNRAIHFRPEVDKDDRPLALIAIQTLVDIVSLQFGAFGKQPWFIVDVPGECYIKGDWEHRPFVRRIYLPNCLQVGPRHVVVHVLPWRVNDENVYDEKTVTDDEYCKLRREALPGLA